MSNQCRNGKPKYKGIETFLKRLAFNLGNSPSQTDVKIISCIPIDVTDLQQRICNLEKQLKDKTKINCAFAYPATVNYDRQDNIKECSTSCNFEHSHHKTPENGIKEINFITNNLTTEIPQEASQDEYLTLHSSEEKNKENTKALPPYKKTFDCQEKIKESSIFNFINTKQKKKTRKTFKTNQIVYHARTENPMKFTSIYKRDDGLINKVPFNHSYLNNVVQRQFKPTIIYDSTDFMSQFSTPVCRDMSSSCQYQTNYPREICSCCSEHFTNIDNEIKEHRYFCNTNNIHKLNQDDKDNRFYYDSSLYDLIPVRDKPKHKKTHEDFNKINEIYRNMEVFTHYNQVKLKSKSHPPTRTSKRKKNITRRKSAIKFDEREKKTNSYVDCGKVYMKKYIHHSVNMNNKQQAEHNTPYINKPTNVNEKVITTEPVLVEDEIEGGADKNEECLHEIKSILQNVLHEIKTNSKTKNDVGTIRTPDIKKDAFVQNTSHNSSMSACSRLVNSFNYSPYSINPYNMPSCSYNPHSNQMCPMMPYQTVRCVQPIMVQTPKRVCADHLKQQVNIQGPCQNNNYNKVNSASTNTACGGDNCINSNETKKLIKEIYKSLTLNLDSEGSQVKDDYFASPKHVDNDRAHKRSNGNIYNSNKTVSRSESMTPTNRSVVSRTATDKTDEVNDTVTYRNSGAPERQVVGVTQSTLNKITERVEEENVAEMSDTSSSKSASSVETVVTHHTRNINTKHVPKNNDAKTTSFISKIMNSVKLFKKKTASDGDKKTQQNKMSSEDSETSDDEDDYMTVYSGKTNQHRHQSRRAHVSPHVHYQEKRPKYQYNKYRSYPKPNMEQEYRRYWAERLAFQERNYHSSEVPMSNDSMKRPVYWQNVETRAALVNNVRSPMTNPIKMANVDRINYRPKLDRVYHKLGYGKDKTSTPRVKSNSKNTALTWLRKYKSGVEQCGNNWKKMILES